MGSVHSMLDQSDNPAKVSICRRSIKDYVLTDLVLYILTSCTPDLGIMFPTPSRSVSLVSRPLFADIGVHPKLRFFS